jgi:hypothetical protein
MAESKVSRLEEQLDNRTMREKTRGEQAAELTGFVGGALALGALGPEGKAMIPATVAGLDSDLVIGGALMFLSRGSGKRKRMLRGAAFAALAGGLRDLGASLGKGF